MNPNQALFVENHLSKHLKLGDMEVMRACYFQYLSGKNGADSLKTADRIQSGNIRFADLLRI